MKEILEFMDCSLCYHLKYVEKVEPEASLVMDDKNKAFQDCMNEAISFYFVGHMEKKPPTLKQMYDKFYSLWLSANGEEDQSSILTRPLKDAGRHKREENSKFIRKGYEAIKNFYSANAKLKQSVLAVNHPYEIMFDGVMISGEFSLIREVMGEGQNRNIQIVSFPLSKRKPDPDVLERDLSLTMSAYAFRSIFGAEPDNLLLHFVSRGEELPVYRSSNDYKRLFSVLEAFLKSVDTIPPFPKPGGHRIYSPYKKYCDTYKFK